MKTISNCARRQTRHYENQYPSFEVIEVGGIVSTSITGCESSRFMVVDKRYHHPDVEAQYEPLAVYVNTEGEAISRMIEMVLAERPEITEKVLGQLEELFKGNPQRMSWGGNSFIEIFRGTVYLEDFHYVPDPHYADWDDADDHWHWTGGRWDLNNLREEDEHLLVDFAERIETFRSQYGWAEEKKLLSASLLGWERKAARLYEQRKEENISGFQDSYSRSDNLGIYDEVGLERIKKNLGADLYECAQKISEKKGKLKRLWS